jgi:carbon-monoxide dehydrogenase large subunit
VGEPLAVVVAATAAQAVDAAETVLADLDPLAPVPDAAAALTDKSLLFEEAGTNVAGYFQSPAADRLDELTSRDWPVMVRLRVPHTRIAPVPIEPLSVVVAPGQDGGFTIWTGHQAPHRLRDQLARMLRLPQERIRVVVPDTGGSFGLKMAFYPEYAILTAAALQLGRPLRWLETRYESFMSGTHGRDQVHDVILAGDADGRFRFYAVDLLADVGAYPHNGAVIPFHTYGMGAGPYDIEEVAMRATTVVTNRATTGVYRGAAGQKRR